jgi:hypothetical protein
VLRFMLEENGRLSRREWLRVGGLAGLGLLAGPSGRVLSAPGFGRARSVILVYTSGGQSQLDTWDPKPHAPVEIRGEFRAIRTSVPGTLVSEHLPRLAQLAERYTILRSLTHDDTDHGSATYLALTGQFHPRKSSNPPQRPNDAPTYGAILQRVRPVQHFPASAVHINGPVVVPEQPSPGQNAGLLGRACEPLLIGDVTRGHAAVGGLDSLPELPAVRVAARRSLLASLDGYRHHLQANPALLEMDVSYRQAYDLLAAPQCRRAFDLAQEAPAVRERYGRHRSGQACLLARRLVEAGVPLVTVFWSHNIRGQDKTPDEADEYGWDTHNDIFASLRQHLLPRFDESFAALLEDLDQRGLLAQTLVICMGEFGRAPLVALEPKFAGSTPGRKHWAGVYSAVLAGAGVARGGLVGASDRMGAYPQSEPVGPWDVAATMFAALGIDPGSHYTDSTGRPYALTTGQPIDSLYRG